MSFTKNALDRCQDLEIEESFDSFLAEAEGRKIVKVEKPVEWETSKTFSNKDKFVEMISGKKLFN